MWESTVEGKVVAIPIVAGIEAVTIGLLSQSISLRANESVRRISLIVRLPIAINIDAIPVVDYAGDSFNMAQIRTAIEALGIVVRNEPTEIETQNT
jgi:hypothetical protein